MNKPFTYLALGDSYTIGEAVPLPLGFPYQTIQLLRKSGYHFSAPEIIARTGWTTDELAKAISEYSFLKDGYDFVSLLIGVNNQYRAYPVEQYKKEFEALLLRSIALVGGKKEHVMVLSIPDYSVTPFAKDKNPEKIKMEIDLYNSINQQMSSNYQVSYINITPGTREAEDNPGLIADDGLHPSKIEYHRWAKQIAKTITYCLAQ